MVWDVAATLECGEAVQLHRLTLHKVCVRDMAFSPDDVFLASLGGRDDNNLVIWHVKSGEPVCGAPAASASAECLAWYKTSARLVTAGQYHARIWDFDPSQRKLRPTDCRLGSVKRVFSCAIVSDSDDYIYCGSLSGEVFQLNAHNGHFITSSARRYQKGITAIDTFNPPGAREDRLVVGSGNGTLATLIAKRGEPLTEERCALRRRRRRRVAVAAVPVQADPVLTLHPPRAQPHQRAGRRHLSLRGRRRAPRLRGHRAGQHHAGGAGQPAD